MLARDVRMGNLRLVAAASVMDRFSQDLAFYLLLKPTAEDFREAARLLLEVSTGLRGPDALHLAIARRRGAILYTFDQTLLRAAATLGVPASDAGIGAP